MTPLIRAAITSSVLLWGFVVASTGAGVPQLSGAGYVLGPDDEIVIRIPDVDEINEKSYRIDAQGNINLPMIGRTKAAGLSAEQLENDISRKLGRYVRKPEVSITVKEFRSQPVSVLGAVGHPGVQQVQGHKNLYEVLSMAGGLSQDAGNTIRITRSKESGPIPLPGAKSDRSGRFTVAEVSVRSVMEARDPGENIEVRPNDVILVPKADVVYVIGSVNKPGGFPLNEREPISVLQALSLAQGTDRMASARNARILRSVPGKPARTEIPVDLNKLLAGAVNDVPLLPNDILFVPSNRAKSAGLRSLEAVIQLGTGIAIYRR